MVIATFQSDRYAFLIDRSREIPRVLNVDFDVLFIISRRRESLYYFICAPCGNPLNHKTLVESWAIYGDAGPAVNIFDHNHDNRFTTLGPCCELKYLHV